MKKGFTLIELIVVMTIIIAITAGSVISYSRLTRNMKEKEYNRIVEEFEAAAEVFVASNYGLREKIYSGDGYAAISLRTLNNEGLINLAKEKDPVTGIEFDGSNYVNVYLDENRNIFAKFMSDSNYVFMNARNRDAVLAGSTYDRAQMVEYIIGYARGQYNETTGDYQTVNISTDDITITILDITDPSDPVSVDSIMTTAEYVDHTFEITYKYHFPDGDKTAQRTVIVYNQVPELASISLSPDYSLSNLTAESVTITAVASSLHDTLTYHFVINDVDHTNTTGVYTLDENAIIRVYVEDDFGGISESLDKVVTYISHSVEEPGGGNEEPGGNDEPGGGNEEPGEQEETQTEP